MKTTNEIKKGEMVMLANGWEARIEDNRKGNVRLATVYGMYTEMGSVYSSDIRQVKNTSGEWESVSITSKQSQTAANRAAWGF